MIKLISLDDEEDFKKLGRRIKENFNDLFRLEDLLDKDYNYIFGYYNDKGLVGFIHISKSYEVVDIINVVVDGAYLRCGIATELLNYVFNYFNDVDKYMLEVKVTNEAAINLYKKNAFKVISTREKYYDGVDAYIMERSI